MGKEGLWSWREVEICVSWPITKKLEKLNERALRYIFNDFDTDYQDLAGSNGGMLDNRCKKELLYILYKALNNQLPPYITSMHV